MSIDCMHVVKYNGNGSYFYPRSYFRENGKLVGFMNESGKYYSKNNGVWTQSSPINLEPSHSRSYLENYLQSNQGSFTDGNPVIEPKIEDTQAWGNLLSGISSGFFSYFALKSIFSEKPYGYSKNGKIERGTSLGGAVASWIPTGSIISNNIKTLTSSTANYMQKTIATRSLGITTAGLSIGLGSALIYDGIQDLLHDNNKLVATSKIVGGGASIIGGAYSLTGSSLTNWFSNTVVSSASNSIYTIGVNSTRAMSAISTGNSLGIWGGIAVASTIGIISLVSYFKKNGFKKSKKFKKVNTDEENNLGFY